jgi:hypothetical protein
MDARPQGLLTSRPSKETCYGIKLSGGEHPTRPRHLAYVAKALPTRGES